MTGPDGLVYDPADCRIGVRSGHTLLHVTLWHPNWGSAKTAALRSGLFGSAGMTVAPDVSVARELLDAALGSVVAETWIGTVEVTDHSPAHAVTMGGLHAMVERMASDAVDPDGDPEWTELRMHLDGALAVVRTLVPLAPSVAPGHDRHVAVSLHVDPVSASDLTGAQVRSTVLALEDALTATVRENRAGLPVAVVHRSGEGLSGDGSITAAAGEGTDDVVVLHYYLGSPGADPDHVLNTLRATVSTWELGKASLVDDVDPAWAAVQHFRV